MCGIIGYKGKKSPKEVLIEGLKNLEYRGYDSAGIALKQNENIQIIKSVGKILNLEEKINNTNLINATVGIAHTRWATHGGVTEINAHPHQVGKTTLVHNGIIENAEELRTELLNKGVTFKGQTDTEVLCALLNSLYEGNALDSINKLRSMVKGSYALGILFEDDEKLYAIRKDSPLIVGLGKEENYIASDIAAIINYTNKYILLEEGEIAVVEEENITIYKDGKQIDYTVQETDMSVEAKDKCGFDHYMLKEINEEPVVLEKTLNNYIDDLSKLPDLRKYEEIHIVACGSAMYAGMIGKSLLEEKADVYAYVECASEYRYKKVFYNKKTLVILISQSGETADTIAAMRKAKENGIDTLAIVNVKTSTIAREADYKLFIEAGPEIAVATTKAYILQVAVLSLLSYKIAKDKGLEKEDLIDEIKLLPKYLKDIIDKREIYLEIAKNIYERDDIFFIGRKVDYSICLEGSLKLKEVSYIHSEAYQAGELKHGTISLIDQGTPVFSIVTDNEIKDKTISNIIEVKSRGAKIITISNEENVVESDYYITVQKVNDYFQPILVVPTLQLIAYEVAKLRGCNIDKPKNLAKSVTVE